MSTRREEIVDIAKRLFARGGYPSTSMRDIAEASGLLAGSLYSHFRSKAQILELIILPFYDRLIPEQEASLTVEAPGAERLEDMLRRVFAVCSKHAAELTILHYDWPHLSGLDEVDAVIERSNRTLELWLQVIKSGVDDGSLRPTIEPEVALRVITSSIHGVLDRVRYSVRADLADELGIEGLADELVVTVLRGLLP